jgi:tRNA U34 5-methylaminomethyl-2-thiouridine-forming methyltransferase MnmC
MVIKQPQLVRTADGSNTLFNVEIGEHYHSLHGALQESRHVFLNAGLLYFLEKNPGPVSVSVLEVGFGTGLNFLLTADYCTNKAIRLHYSGIEAYPLSYDLIKATGYDQYISTIIWTDFIEKYPDTMKEEVTIASGCQLRIADSKLPDFTSHELYDIIYFDAFAAAHQPEMWNEEAIKHTIGFLKSGGVFVTYAITGNLKRMLKSLGCEIQKIKGAPGKREMLRAIRL